MEWKTLELSEQDKAFLEVMEQNTKDIIAIFGIAPSHVGVPCNHTELELEAARKRLRDVVIKGVTKHASI
jgi:phage portal protein BeeE